MGNFTQNQFLTKSILVFGVTLIKTNDRRYMKYWLDVIIRILYTL